MNLQVKAEEMKRASDFFEAICQKAPVRFTLGGEETEAWKEAAKREESRRETKTKTEATVCWTKGGLRLRLEAALWKEHPAVEWTGWLENVGTDDTAQISNVRAFDGILADEMKTNHPGINHTYTLSYFQGDYYSPDGFEQKRHFLSNGIPKTFHNEGGRSCSTEFPYYRLCSHERAIAIAVSWQGQWETSFEFDWLNGVKFSTKLQYFDAYLKPGEKVRTPLVALVFSEDADEDRCINLWRNWMIYDNMPRNKDGSSLSPYFSLGNTGIFGFSGTAEENQLQFINAFAEHDIPFDYWWIDAMWYDCGSRKLPNWCPVGTWDADPVRFPNTLKPVSDRLHEINAQLLAWFEPERVTPGTYIYEEHPEFTLTTPTAESEEIQKGAMGTDTNASIDNSRLLNLADDGVTDWLINKINHTIDVNGIDLYRQDMNTNPLRVWQHNDEPNRVGMLENKYCVNLFRYWDALVEAHPGMIIDTCASGGRRVELETMRRSVVLCKSDYNGVMSTINCGFHHTLYQWLPYFNSIGYLPEKSYQDYSFSTSFALWIATKADVRQDVDYDSLRKLLFLHKKLAPALYGNYYAMLPYSRDPREWNAWQFHCPQKDEGVALVVAHAKSLFTAATLPLREIDAEATYEVRRVKELELGETEEMSGAELAAWKVSFTSFPDACIISYKKKQGI